jgi:hypothetical protein
MSSKTWEVMNDLEMVTSKIVSAREIIDSVADAIQKSEYNKAETLAMAAHEFLGYYLEEFDDKFKKVWKETVVAQKELLKTSLAEREYYEGKDDYMRPWGHSDLEYVIANNKKPLTCDKDDPSPECKGAWTSFWEENYYPEEYYSNVTPSATQRDIDKVVKWHLPVEMDGLSGEYYVVFPDDLLEAADLKEGDQVYWVDNGDGTWMIRKVTKPIKMDEC